MKKRKFLFTLFSGLIVFGLALNSTVVGKAASPMETLAGFIKDVTKSNGYRYGSSDNLGNSMDCAKIIENPYSSGEFLAVYHTYRDNTAKVNLAKSADLLNWTFVVSLAGARGANATQPTIRVMDEGNGFAAAWEQEPNNHLVIAYYENYSALSKGNASKRVDLKDFKFTKRPEGTPNIYKATPTFLDIGFHFNTVTQASPQKRADRQARGTIKNWDSSTWERSAQSHIDSRLINDFSSSWGVAAHLANIGDRDYLKYNGKNLIFIEAGGNNSNFGSWNTYLYDIDSNTAMFMDIKTHKGSKAFANPTFSIVTFKEKQTLVCTLFVPSENNADPAGELIYYRFLSADPTTSTPIKTTSNKTSPTFSTTAKSPASSLNNPKSSENNGVTTDAFDPSATATSTVTAVDGANTGLDKTTPASIDENTTSSKSSPKALNPLVIAVPIVGILIAGAIIFLFFMKNKHKF